MRVTKAIKAEQVRILSEVYAGAKPALQFHNPFELLIAVILSAQCTDKRVNVTTARLFQKAATPAAIVAMGLPALENEIRDCGLFRNKAKNIMATCMTLCEQYGGEVPEDYDELLKLPGVGRKTGNLILGHIYNKPALVVDTHVKRISNRLGLAASSDPTRTEFQLMETVPEEFWIRWNTHIISLGRSYCMSARPDCGACFLRDLCPSCDNTELLEATRAGVTSGKSRKKK